ncbi:MAG: MBL fold metallo-hydrolase [Nitrospira sp.]|nr:MBL fold metallo-hydrolase [Nitrospira sp.]
MNTLRNRRPLLLLLESSFSKDDIQSLINLQWLPTSIDVRAAPFKADTLKRETLGFDFSQKKKFCLTLGSPCIVLTKLPLLGNPCAYESGKFTVISSTQWQGKFINIPDKAILVLHLLKWLVGKHAWKHSDPCLINTEYRDLSKSTAHFCSDCKDRLSSSHTNAIVLVSEALRLLMSSAKDKSEALKKHSGELLRSYNDLSLPTLVRLRHTEWMMDYGINMKPKTRDWLTNTATRVFKEKETIKKSYISRSGQKPRYPTFIAARRWNSWTPAIPENLQSKQISREGKKIFYRKSGGGYLISDGKTCIAVDPGFGFIELLYHFYGLTVCDIDGIVITHDHPDHSAGLQNILTLRYIFRDHCPELKVYLNLSSFNLYQPLLNYHSDVTKFYQLIAKQPIKIGNFEIYPMSVFHDEIVNSCSAKTRKKVGKSTTLGIVFKGQSDDVRKKFFKFSIVGDTSFPTTAASILAWTDFFSDSDIVSLHLGSIEKDWEDLTKKASRITYGAGRHLGIIGVAKMISLLQPKVAVVTEFGEELGIKKYRLAITDTVRQFVTIANSTILPADVGLSLTLFGDEILCRCSCGKYIPVALATPKERNGFINYEYTSGCASKLHHINLA